MARTLAERQQVQAQRKARLAEADAKLAAQERKQRNRRLYQAGGLVEKVGLLGLDANALYGALLSLKEPAGDAGQVERWAAEGGRAFGREAKRREAGKEAVVITFSRPLPKPAADALRAAGFRFNRVLQHWEGLGSYDAADAVARENSGTARYVAQPGREANG